MAVNYLGKKKLHQMACYDAPSDGKPPIMKNCEYKFYRGSEWLKWVSTEECEDGWIEWQLYNCKAYYSLEKVQHLESEFRAVSLYRMLIYHNREVAG